MEPRRPFSARKFGRILFGWLFLIGTILVFVLMIYGRFTGRWKHQQEALPGATESER